MHSAGSPLHSPDELQILTLEPEAIEYPELHL